MRGSYFSSEFEEGEEMLMVVRRHPIVLLGWAVITILGFTLPLLFIKFLLSTPWGSLILAAWMVIVFLVGLRALAAWHMDLLLVTSHRIVRIQQRGLFSRRVHEFAIDEVDDASYHVSGMWSTVLGLGVVEVSAGPERDISLGPVTQPAEIQQVIVGLLATRREAGELVRHQQKLT